MAWGVKSTGVKSTEGECPGGDWRGISARGGGGGNSQGVGGLIPLSVQFLNLHKDYRS